MSNNWIVENIQNALDTWNDKLREIWTLLTQSPETFKGGRIWSVMASINGTLKAVGYALLVLFFLAGIMKQFNSFQEIKRPEQAFKLFLRFALAKCAVTWGLDLMMAIVQISQGIVSRIIRTSEVQVNSRMNVPDVVIRAIDDCGFWESIPLWAVTLIGSLIVTVLSFIMILTVYGRFFKMYMYVAIAPIPMSAFAGEESSHHAKAFVKSFIGVCLEGAIVVLACIIYSMLVKTQPALSATSAVSYVWKYLGEVIFNMLVLVGTVKMSDQVVKSMMGI